MDFDMLNLIGFGATASAVFIFLPQAVTAWKHRDNPQALEGVSVGTQVLVLGSALLWVLYGWYMDAIWVAVHESLGIPISIFIIYRVMKSRQSLPEKTEIPEAVHNL